MSKHRMRRVGLAASLLVAASVGVPAGSSAPSTDVANGKIVFSNAGDLWSVWPDGSRLRNLTKTPDLHEGGAGFSPGGDLLAFGREGDLWLMKPNGNDPRQLTSGGGGPTFAPDGLRIAFGTGTGVDMIYVDGSGRKRLRRAVSDPSWSPTHDEIAVEHKDQVAIMNTRGGKLHDLVKGDEPAFSPDGETIAFLALPTGPSIGHAVWLVNRDGTGLTELPLTGNAAHPDFGGEVTWAPDGTMLAYVKELGSIAIVDLDGSHVANLRGPSSGTLAWRPLPAH